MNTKERSASQAGPDAKRAPAASLPTLSNFFVRKRNRDQLIIGLPTTEQRRFSGARAIVLSLPPASPTIEAGQTIALRHGRFEAERWANGFEAKAFFPDGAEIVPFKPRVPPKIAGIDSATCKRLADKLGADYAAKIAAKPATLAAFRYSEAKRAIIVSACEVEAKAARKVKGKARALVDALRQCGVSASRARSLAALSVARSVEDNCYAFLFVASVGRDRPRRRTLLGELVSGANGKL